MSFGLHRRRLLFMHLEKHKRSASSAAKRALSQPSAAPSSSKLPRLTDTPSVSLSRPFSLSDNNSPFPVFRMPSSSRSHRAAPSRNKQPARASRGHKAVVHPGPKHDEQYIVQQFSNPATPLLAKHLVAPKSSVNNLGAMVLGAVPKYNSVQGSLDGRQVWRYVSRLSGLSSIFLILRVRTTVVLETTPPVTGVGDDADKTKSVSLAALSAAYQLNRIGIVRSHSLFKSPSSDHRSLTIRPNKNPLRQPPSRFQIRAQRRTSKLALSWTIIAAVSVSGSPSSRLSRPEIPGRPSWTLAVGG